MTENSKEIQLELRKRGRSRKTESDLQKQNSETNEEKIAENQWNDGPTTRRKSRKIIDSSFHGI